jgi:hypothetical protein
VTRWRGYLTGGRDELRAVLFRFALVVAVKAESLVLAV